MVTADAKVKVENRGLHSALPLALLSFPSGLHFAFSGKMWYSGDDRGLDAWTQRDLLTGRPKK